MNAMEPPSENRPTLETAEAVGAQRLEKISKWVNRLAAPDILLQIGANAAKDRVDAVREQIAAKALEIKGRVVEKITAAYDRLESGFNIAKDRTVLVAKEVGKRAAIVGLTPVAGAEAVYAKIYELPARFRETLVSDASKRIEDYQKIIATMKEQRTEDRRKITETRAKASNMTGIRSALNNLKTAG